LNPFKRLCLHATRLGFVHPASSAFMRFESPAPAFSRA
jgi:23S rRNA-/tRNA-specific pseudouridylate synthase